MTWLVWKGEHILLSAHLYWWVQLMWSNVTDRNLLQPPWVLFLPADHRGMHIREVWPSQIQCPILIRTCFNSTVTEKRFRSACHFSFSSSLLKWVSDVYLISKSICHHLFYFNFIAVFMFSQILHYFGLMFSSIYSSMLPWIAMWVMNYASYWVSYMLLFCRDLISVSFFSPATPHIPPPSPLARCLPRMRRAWANVRVWASVRSAVRGLEALFRPVPKAQPGPKGTLCHGTYRNMRDASARARTQCWTPRRERLCESQVRDLTVKLSNVCSERVLQYLKG